ncbi:MAG: S8 family serine peptidase [bacterium]|nr:S8 family serine peptidase [bacterium]
MPSTIASADREAISVNARLRARMPMPPAILRSIVIWVMLSLTAISASGSCAESDRWSDCEFQPGRLIVSFKAEGLPEFDRDKPAEPLGVGVKSLDELFSRYEATSLRRLVPDGILSRLKTSPDLFCTYVLSFSPHYSVLDALDDLARDPNVRAVEPDLLRRTCRVPNDPLWSSQWDKRLMGAHRVWDISTGSRNIICVGIDTGVDWNHPDLTPSLWVNPGEDVDGDSVVWTLSEYPGDWDDVNDIDDDSDGYVDDLLGWDFVYDLQGCAPDEDCDSHGDNNMFGRNSHGTHVAGIMCAAGNNGIGVAGLSWVGRLMALRAGFQSADGLGYILESASSAAILYAAAHGAKVINMSYGSSAFLSTERDVMDAAWNQGCLLVAASGNEGATELHYPAAYDNVIAVNATNDQDRLAHWSNRGWWTDLCAPGAEPGIMSTVINGYEARTGTSMASPNAAGVAALVWSVFPQLANGELRSLLQATAQNPGVDPTALGSGRVDAFAAIASHAPERPAAARPDAVTLHGNYPNPFNSATTIAFDLAAASPVKLQVCDVLGRAVAVLVNNTLNAGAHRVAFDASGLAGGVYVAHLEAAGTTVSSKMMLIK